MSDIGLRLSEGLQELKLDQQLAPTREAISRTITAGSTGFFKAMEGVRGRWMQRSASATDTTVSSSASSSVVDVSKSDAASIKSRGSVSLVSSPDNSPQPPPSQPSGIRPLSLVGSAPPPQPPPPVPDRSSFSWGAGIGSFFSQRANRMSTASRQSTLVTPPREASPAPSVLAVSTKARAASLTPTPEELGGDELHPRNLDEIYGTSNASSPTESLATLPLHTAPPMPPMPALPPLPPIPDVPIAPSTHRTRLSSSTHGSGRQSEDLDLHDEEVGMAV